MINTAGSNTQFAADASNYPNEPRRQLEKLKSSRQSSQGPPQSFATLAERGAFRGSRFKLDEGKSEWFLRVLHNTGAAIERAGRHKQLQGPDVVKGLDDDGQLNLTENQSTNPLIFGILRSPENWEVACGGMLNARGAFQRFYDAMLAWFKKK